MTTPPQPPIAPGPSNGGPVHPPQPTGLSPEPPRKPHWWRDAGKGAQIAIVCTVAAVPALVLLFIAGQVGFRIGGDAPKEITFNVEACEFNGATVRTEFTAANSGDSDRRITIHWEYRDSSGARVDTDTTRVTVPAGDTIRDSESTLLPVEVTGGQCGYSVS